MWIFAVEGFVSVVAVRGSGEQLLVRARVRQDAAAWHALVVGKGTTGIKNTVRADYPWRFVTTRAAFAQAFAKMVTEGLKYDNFKNAVARDNPERSHAAYMDVWATMRNVTR